MTLIANQKLSSIKQASHHLKYRSDIDGLRAIAVLSVVIFHLGTGLLSGGFVGVDIFFVISGFLISKIIYTETASGNFSITNFYVRRVRRILPGLLSVIIVCSIFAGYLLYPSELVSYAKSAIATALFSANIYFYSTLNYFGQSAVEIPLLHLWSLGVEEQFYILFPLLAITMASSPQRNLRIVILTLLAASLVSSVWLLVIDPSAAFYLLPFRAFEMLIGSALALPKRRISLGKLSSAIACAVGLACIAIAIFCYDKTTLFPGLAALLPCLGAALIIYSGEQENGVSKKVLGNSYLASIGKISYSLYLVHWPIIVFGKRAFPHTDEYTFAALAFALSIFLAYLNYKYIEQNFRQPKSSQHPAKVLGASLISLVGVICFSGLIVYKNGSIESVDARIQKALSYLTYNTKQLYKSGTCFQTAEQDPASVDISSCLPDRKGKKVMLWGDSHAAHYISGLSKTFEQHGYSLGFLTAQSCPPIMGVTVLSNPRCGAFNEMALPVILKEKPEMIIMSAYWMANDITMDLLELTIRRLSDTGIKLVILGEGPIYKFNVPAMVADRIKTGRQDFISSEELEHAFLDNSYNVMRTRFSNRQDVKFVPVMDIICPGYKCPLTTPDGTPTAFDIAHLTKEGSEMFSERLTPAILD
ncbi:TPA: acyltransferase [Pseudomonas putida]|nr:acyltransferase [Pseudomonas putida]